MNHNQQRLHIVTEDKTAEFEELRAEFRAFREEVRLWQAVTCGVVAGLSLILGALVMACK